MTTQRQERIHELSQLGYRTRKLPSLLAQVSEAIGVHMSENNILPFEVSEEIRHTLRGRIKEILRIPSGSEHLLLPPTERSLFDSEFSRLVHFFGSENVVLCLGRFDDLPLLQIRPADIRDHFYDLWRIGDTVAICSTDATRGFMADWYPDDPEQSFEIARWGLN